MLSRLSFPLRSCGKSVRGYSSNKRATVVVCGASGGIGQPLSLLLKQSPLVSKLVLYDVVHANGVAADLSHIDTDCVVEAYEMGLNNLRTALTGADVVMIPAGMPRKPGMTRDDLFKSNAEIVKSILEECSDCCQKALIGVISNPVNSTVPIAAEVLKRAGCYDPKRLFGVTSLDIVRSNTFVARARGLDPSAVHVPVVGGHSGVTIVPLISKATPKVAFTQDEIIKITERIQDAGTEVVKAKAGRGSATLSMAYAGSEFAFKLIRALRGEPNLTTYAYIASDVTPTPFFAGPVRLGPEGVVGTVDLGRLSPYEQELLDRAIEELKQNIQKGVDFITKAPPKNKEITEISGTVA